MNINDIKISIVVPIYNTEKYLRECLNSLISQTLREIEIILVDDGSTDLSGKICDEYKEKYNNIRVIHQLNAGQSAARNNGVKVAKGEYIQYVDSDDYIIPTACEYLYNAAKQSGADIVRGDCLNEKDDVLNDRTRNIDCENRTVSAMDYMVKAIDNNMYDIVTWLDIVKRSTLLKYNISFLEGVFYEDHEYMMHLLMNPDVKMLKKRFPFYYYRPSRKGSTTNICNIKKGTDIIQVINGMVELKSKSNIKEKRYIQYLDAVIAMAVYHLSQVWHGMADYDKRSLKKYITKEIKCYGVKTKKLSNRMKIQNRLFLYIPWLLEIILKMVDKGNMKNEKGL